MMKNLQCIIKKEYTTKKDELLKKVKDKKFQKSVRMNLPYFAAGYFTNVALGLYRNIPGSDISEKGIVFMQNASEIFTRPVPSFYFNDIFVGIACGVVVKILVIQKMKDSKKFRNGEEYGSARWGNEQDIEPYVDENFESNIILTQTERLTMSSRPQNPKYARNKNVLVIGGSGSGKTRFYVKANLMQLHSSYVTTDPKGSLLTETGKMFEKNGYEIRTFNTINFKKSMHYNRATCSPLKRRRTALY